MVRVMSKGSPKPSTAVVDSQEEELVGSAEAEAGSTSGSATTENARKSTARDIVIGSDTGNAARLC
jgi:hypothetical protein